MYLYLLADQNYHSHALKPVVFGQHFRVRKMIYDLFLVLGTALLNMWCLF